MKNNILLLSLTTLTLVACAPGGGKKNPVGSDLETIRRDGKRSQEMGPAKPVVKENTVVVTNEKEVVKYLKEPHASDLVINHDPQLGFVEGKKTSYDIRVRVLIPTVTAKLVASNLPDGATFTQSAKDKDLYTLTWQPAYYSTQNELVKTFPAKITAQVVSTGTAADPEKVKVLKNEKDIFLLVTRTQEAPSELKISGLPNEVAEGTETTFTVTAKVPGVDGSAPKSQQPKLVIYYDGKNRTEGNSFQEMNGSRHIPSLDFKTEYVKDSGLWKYTLIFDTKNIAPQPQLATNGSLLAQADGTRVRLSFKVYGPNGQSTDDSSETLRQVKIKYGRKISAPRFDMSGIGKTALEVSRGETINLRFVVSAPLAESNVAVVASSTLPGSPTVVCQASAQGAQKQNCLLSWTVPCEAELKDLTGTVDMKATDAAADAGYNSTDYTLKTKAAAKDKKLCGNGKK